MSPVNIGGLTMITTRIILIACACLVASVGLTFAETDQTAAAAPGDQSVPPAAPNSTLEPNSARSYDPSGRRDPFIPVLQQFAVGSIDPSLPPLQRVGLTEMNLIAVVWGAYGNTAMVQTPDGNGYTVRRGTRIGPNNGVVTAVTEKGIVVQERFTDVYGTKQEREYVKLLHPKEGAE
jgi:type IV pilus assembly protein PilP